MKEEYPHPPRALLKILAWFCPGHLYEEIAGDLIQRFNKDVNQHGARKARRRLLWNVVRFCRPSIIMRNKNSITLNQLSMIGNYFKVASRVMIRNKAYSTINILGLTLGMASAILLFLWIEKEFSYDQFHADKERIYVAFNRDINKTQISCWSVTPRILAPTLVEEYPTVESAASLATWSPSHLFTAGDKKIVKTTGAFTDPQLLTILSFPLIKGDASKALGNPNSIVLTESFARQLFGEKEAFGESLSISESGYTFPFTVTGVLKDLPDNTDIHFDYLISFQFLESIGEKNDHWGNNSVTTYVKLRSGESHDRFNGLVKNIVKKHYHDVDPPELFLYPLTKMHLYSRFENGVPAGGRIEIIRMMGILGVCLVVIACINFVNLSTARAQKRSREVGVRKVTGARRYSLVAQFLCESILIAAGAGVLSLLLVYLLLPSFALLIQQPLSLAFQNKELWLTLITGVLLIGLLAGLYPSLYLSSFNPVRVLKGAPIASGRGTLRQILVVFQFGMAVMMIISVIVIGKQIRFAQNRLAGYSKDHLIYHTLTGDLDKNYEAYKGELVSRGIATSVTKTSSPITQRLSNTTNIGWAGKDPESKILFERFYVDEDIVTTAGLALVKGRDMDLQSYPSDSSAMMLNETAVKLMGLKDPINELITDNGREWHVVGVVKDFILTSPYQKIVPMVLIGAKGLRFNDIHIRLNPNRSTQQNIADIGFLFSKYNPSYPFEYHFVDQEYERKFNNTRVTLLITGVFGSIIIFIACLGLLGLSTFMIETRTKEIGIRKVLGSSVIRIVQLLSIDTLKPILIAILLFSPGAWISMNWWLQSFDYRISLSPWVFVMAAGCIITIALLTIIIQTAKAAHENPVTSLRSE